ncbi:hypothetical protein ACFQI7_26410 [Paenibacillus allorhizosphaerae]|uniref:hypothetical protein n=1 Tax=Paenibacillus allorhizosphaerae TaxID=2849866 RepID=UPI001C40313A|nr:hypothetical protein [Paenibacillus allorhizosphaerae]
MASLDFNLPENRVVLWRKSLSRQMIDEANESIGDASAFNGAGPDECIKKAGPAQ